VQAFSNPPRAVFLYKLPSIKMNIPGRVNVEYSQHDNQKGPLPAANLDMSSKSPQSPSGGWRNGCDDLLNTLGAWGESAKQPIPPHLPRVLGISSTLSVLRESCYHRNRLILFPPPMPDTAPPLPAAVPNSISTSKPSFRVLICNYPVL